MVGHAQGRGVATRVWVAAVHVSDLDQAVSFYRDVLGFPLQLDARQFGWMEVGPKEPLCKIGLTSRLSSDAAQRADRSTGIILEVDDMDRFFERLKSLGIRFTREPTKSPWGGVVADFLDPDGNEIEAVYDPGHYDTGRRASRDKPSTGSE
jgi:catechol 2,3-dioxygenase-like lactoylglutathione lyase family enzyme